MLKYYDEHFFIACQRKNYCQKFSAGLLFSFSISVQIKFITALFDLKYELVCQVTRNSFACQDGQDNTEKCGQSSETSHFLELSHMLVRRISVQCAFGCVASSGLCHEPSGVLLLAGERLSVSDVY